MPTITLHIGSSFNGCYTPIVGLPWLIFLSSPPIKHHRRFYPPPFRLQPHHPAEPLMQPSIVEGYLQVDMVGIDRQRKKLTRIWNLLTLVLVASTLVATRMKALLKFLQPNKVSRIPTGSSNNVMLELQECNVGIAEREVSKSE
ncbi:hypothetical protein HanRHA438_Chr12g0574431 [Helianthus annuus]|uniref:Uncharacterized protein n=1 Tax=Helianthus annuus TaxID=4232 RepID=A0A251T6M4_HELAN|nr:uncharacterized protein LOC110896026 isoform X2 [Helianthus annuus]KAF5779746.1 hypothetical protein HanXRQr2_Chr12g0563111 [Helianthus annuus]KAJ0491013.1 hypothetical protein HanHA300_Chr12g0462071 [Helianthus annuus]KAJ0495369.1 hypothetical protein HanIR_Chr12g0608031 [Helianthus annuus]KAJ0506920.1 hypothetical protein HanHA89_Chr12g0487491 [Helianthus annuus]KAJ0676556.1 hypothetical protein HanLR1_Chr12g0464091 [Helianthus annuus]